MPSTSGMPGASMGASGRSSAATGASTGSEMITSGSTASKDSFLKVYLTRVQAEGFADGFYTGVITMIFLLVVVWLIYCCCKTRRAWQNLDDSHHQDTPANEMQQVRAARPGFDSNELRWEVCNARPSDNEPDAPPAPPDPFHDGIAWRR